MKVKKLRFQILVQKIITKWSLDKRLLHFKREQQLKEKLYTLSGQKTSAEELYKQYIEKKITYFLKGITVLIMVIVCMSLFGEKETLEGNSIIRNGYGELEKGITLIAKSEGMEEEIVVSIEARHYTKNELDIMADEVFQILQKEVFLREDVIKENKIYIVRQHLYLPANVAKYPFSIVWESNNYEVIDENGYINEMVSEDGEEVCITAKLSCYEYVWEKEYYLKVFPIKKNWNDSFKERLSEAIETIDINTAHEETLLLPNEVEGHRIAYETKREYSNVVVMCFGIMALVLMFFSMDNALLSQIENRNSQLLCDYAKLVSKLSLYLGAGVSLRTAFTRILQNIDRTRFYVRELEVTMREINNGISENEAIEKFARRCNLSCYIKLGVLINQNMKKGNNQLCEQLKLESKKAFEERKNIARKYGEEAGTKLLFPMLLMLLVVMVIIMYPAFVSFTV